MRLLSVMSVCRQFCFSLQDVPAQCGKGSEVLWDLDSGMVTRQDAGELAFISPPKIQ